MIRRINYTKRKKIKSDSFIIELIRVDGKITSFTATIDFTGMNLPQDADIFIEPYHQTERMRFSMGKVQNVKDIENQSLSLLARHESIKFRILVVDNSGDVGQIIAYTDRIHPVDKYAEDLHKHGILPIDFKNLGRQTWRVEFREEPVLVINKEMQNPHGIVKTDLRFFFFVFPSVIKVILTHLFFFENLNEYEEPIEEWYKNWLDFSKMFNPGEIPENNGDNKDALLEWIDNVIDGFCNSRATEWKNFIRILDGAVDVSG